MSRYSGKCDIFDHFGDYSDERLSQCNIYLDNNIIPLRINNQHDLAPYYPYLMVMGGSSDGVWNCHMSSRSFTDAEEEEHLGWKLKSIQKYWRKCKRNKKPYVVDEAMEKECFFGNEDTIRKIAEIVAKYGDKTTVHDLIFKHNIRSHMHEHYRNTLLEKMIELGWDEKQAKYWIWKDWRCLMGDNGET